jgi:DNA-directed RNA polymerase subunit RPC12/RpoP
MPENIDEIAAGKEDELEMPTVTDVNALECESCGGDFEVRYEDKEQRDRFAVCRYCGARIDLPERVGSTRERRETGRDGSVVYEKFTSWRSMSGDAPPGFPLDDLAGSADVREETREFNSPEEMMEFLKQNLPNDEAEEILRNIKLDRGGDSSTTTSSTFTTTITASSSKTTEGGDLLGRLGKWLKKK